MSTGGIRLGRSNGCWIDLFDAENFQGNRIRLYGPADFPGLRLVDDNSDRAVMSLRIGRGAYVQCFVLEDSTGTLIWLLPGQNLERISGTGISAELNSIRLCDRPPFAHEAGFTEYMLWAASHIARLESVGIATSLAADGNGSRV